MYERELTPKDPLIECEICGKRVRESETVNVFMDFKDPKDVCENHYDEWLGEEEKQEIFETIKEALKNEDL